MTTGTITTFAGNPIVGPYNGDEISADTAQFDPNWALVFDSYGNLFISEYGEHRIRKIDSAHIIHTVAGLGVSGYSGDGGPATAAKINNPEGVAIDHCDNLYISDEANNRIRKVTFHSNCFPESVNEVRTGNDIVIYPNPAKEQLTITGTSLMAIAVMNAIGQVLIAQKNYNSNKAIVNVSSLAAGVYFIRVSDKNGNVVTKRFVKE